MKVLVTGATGFLGRHTVPKLLAQGHSVRALVRRRASSELDGAEIARGDVTRPQTLAAACDGVDAVVHLAGAVGSGASPAGRTRLFQVHVEGTRNTLVAAREAGVQRFVHLSSSGTIAVSPGPEQIADEDFPWATETVRHWPYYLAKIYAEKLALEEQARGKLPVVILNPSLLLGPGDDAMGSTKTVVRYLRREIPAVPPGGLNFVDVRDTARATVAALSQGRSGERYLLGGPNMTVEHFFVLLERVSGIPAPGVTAPSALHDWTTRVLGTLEELSEDDDADEALAYAMAGHYWYLDARKAKAELGFEARPAEDTLDDTVHWLRDRGPLPQPRSFLGTAVRGLRRVFDAR